MLGNLPWTEWWFWLAIALAFAILEVLAPVFLFLGLAAGAAFVGILLAMGVGFGGSIPTMLVVFAFVSVVASVILRRVMGVARGKVKLVEEDIND